MEETIGSAGGCVAPVKEAAAGWWLACVTISTVSGSSLEFVIASDVASRAGGMWSSVTICEGIWDDAWAGASSWTFRSNIIEDAGECVRGEADLKACRPGEAGEPYGCARGDEAPGVTSGELGANPPFVVVVEERSSG